MLWYSHHLKNFPHFVVIYTVKGFSLVNEAEVGVFFWNSLAFSMIQLMLAIWPLGLLPFLNPTWTSGSSQFTYCWSLAWRILSITFLVGEVAQLCLTLCTPMDCSLPGSSVHGIFQARVMEWIAISFSRGSSWPRNQTRVSRIVGRHFYHLSYQGSSLNIPWHCLSLGLEWKLTFSSPVATAEFSKLANILSAALSQYHLLGFGIAQLELHHLQ